MMQMLILLLKLIFSVADDDADADAVTVLLCQSVTDAEMQDPMVDSGKPPRSGQTKRIPSVVLSGEDYTYNLKGLSNNTYYNVVIR